MSIISEQKAIGTVLDIWDVLSLVFGLGGNMGAIIAFLGGVPLVYPILIAIISSLSLLYGIIKVIMGYKKWRILMVTKQPLLERILRLLFDMHRYLDENGKHLHEAKPTRTQFRKFSRAFLNSLKLTEEKFIKKVNVTNPEKLLKKQLKGVHKINTNDYTSVSGFLLDIASSMDKEKMGLISVREQEDYRSMYQELNHLELELPASITMPGLDLLDRAYQLSYGLHSMGLFMSLSYNRYQKKIPEKNIKDWELYMRNLDLMYRKALFQVKRTIIKSFIEEY